MSNSTVLTPFAKSFYGTRIPVSRQNALRKETSTSCPRSLLITAFALSLIALTIAILATVASYGGLSPNSALYKLTQIGQTGSVILFTLTMITTLFIAYVLFKSCRETCRETCRELADRFPKKSEVTKTPKKESKSDPTSPTTPERRKLLNRKEVHFSLVDNGETSRSTTWVFVDKEHKVED